VGKEVRATMACATWSDVRFPVTAVNITYYAAALGLLLTPDELRMRAQMDGRVQRGNMRAIRGWGVSIN
jgi:hypothetical protein